MNSHQARAILGGFFGSIFGLAGLLLVLGGVVAHLLASGSFTDVAYCGVAEGTAIWLALLVLVSPVFVWLAFIGTMALGFDDGPLPFIVAAFVLVAVVGNDAWLVVSKVSAQNTAAEMRRGFGGELELSRQLFRESGFCRFYDAVF